MAQTEVIRFRGFCSLLLHINLEIFFFFINLEITCRMYCLITAAVFVSINGSNNRLIGWSVSQSIGRSVGQSVSQSVPQSFSKWSY